MTTKTFPYEILRIGPLGAEAQRVRRGKWPSHVPLPSKGDKINDISLVGMHVVRARLFTTTTDKVQMVTLYIE